MKCPKNRPSTIDVTDEAGVHSMTPKSAALLCVPACLAAGKTCNFNDQCCSGTCTAFSCM